VRYVGDLTPIPQDYLDVINSKTVVKLPSIFTIGAGIGETKKWVVGTEITFQESNTFTNRLNDDVSNVRYENGINILLEVITYQTTILLIIISRKLPTEEVLDMRIQV
jgi:hypothetical protein